MPIKIKLTHAVTVTNQRGQYVSTHNSHIFKSVNSRKIIPEIWVQREPIGLSIGYYPFVFSAKRTEEEATAHAHLVYCAYLISSDLRERDHAPFF